MNELWFRSRMAGLQKQCADILSQELSAEQLAIMGAEFESQKESVLELLRSRGLLYRQR